MYLKRVELHGFKSFANKERLILQPGIIGVVGPNGCGKSNISDAIRWVLGEQSVKSLRGSTMTDVIFVGSEERHRQNLAEVTLVFDNKDHFFKSDYEELEITRRLYRQNSESEYLLNRQKCRLKDVVDILMDTGLGRDSLSIISQGNILAFADSKPDERRGLFEEAAGVAKYKKRKVDATRKLERTRVNVERVGDIVCELEKQIGPLEKQKNKAEQYVVLKKELTAIEVSLLAKEIGVLQDSLDCIRTKAQEVSQELIHKEAKLTLEDTKLEQSKAKMYSLDKEINALQSQLMDIIQEVSTLETRKVEIDHRLEYQREHPIDNEAKKAAIKEKLQDIVSIYNDRIKRLQDIHQEVVDLKQKQTNNRQLLTEKMQEIEQLTYAMQRKKSRQEMLEDAIENRHNWHRGVKAIMERGKEQFGIIGVVEDIVTPQMNYELAIATALGGALQYVVIRDDIQARQAISFLHKNQAGRATFLPLNVVKPRMMRPEHRTDCQQLDGYLGLASDFVSYPEVAYSAIINLLGTVIISDTLVHAQTISRALKNRYRVVCLSGDIINIGGSLTGGSQPKQNSIVIQKQELSELNQQIHTIEKKLVATRNEHALVDNQSKELAHQILQKQMLEAKLEVVVQDKKEELVILKTEYEGLTNQQVEWEEFNHAKESTLVQEWNQAVASRDALTEQIQTKRNLRMQYVTESENTSQDLKVIRKEIKQLQDTVSQYQIEMTRSESFLETYLQRLNSEYAMTYEYASAHYTLEQDIEQAKQQVLVLRSKIESLGTINMNAIEEFQQLDQRYHSMQEQRLDLLQAQESIMEAIHKMDHIMVDRFSRTFDQINIAFNEVFQRIFGGGKASIHYSDPHNILETGIDIEVQPPGKAVQNISLFSGGEKSLIAISCLFAILKVRPVPMCVLDEVEAALDVANIDRFGQYLKELSRQTQFIVVTHRFGTMEICDLLYGATMQQKGITKLVSVQLEQAQELSEKH